MMPAPTMHTSACWEGTDENIRAKPGVLGTESGRPCGAGASFGTRTLRGRAVLALRLSSHSWKPCPTMLPAAAEVIRSGMTCATCLSAAEAIAMASTLLLETVSRQKRYTSEASAATKLSLAKCSMESARMAPAEVMHSGMKRVPRAAKAAWASAVWKGTLVAPTMAVAGRSLATAVVMIWLMLQGTRTSWGGSAAPQPSAPAARTASDTLVAPATASARPESLSQT
mmetsp:Transcript_49005/g.138468  ORF Transcript_49005/g.138468 Transcript_49005/m.138468 type:complete len:227 (-) Transcript_49005:1254-1934(-)